MRFTEDALPGKRLADARLPAEGDFLLSISNLRADRPSDLHEILMELA